ncbi:MULTISPECIES: hypothetical protein [unclassified Methylobacterium]|uniref:hypothetical protein n=1 Tax=unclassified Methylobacterium TaxID=2615210 RepID=UPI00370006F9
MSYGLETIGGLVGGMAGGGWGLVKGAAVGGVLGAGIGGVAGAGAGTLAGAATGGPGGIITIPAGAAGGALAGGIGGAAIGGGYGAVTGTQHGVESGRAWGRWLSEKVDEAQKKAKAKPKTEADTDCNGCKPANPCEHLKKGKGDGPYRGGGHGNGKDVGTSSPRGDELDSHHMPAKQSYKGLGLSLEDGPAIQMRPEDHQDTADYGGRGQKARDSQRKLIEGGNFDKAFEQSAENVKDIAKQRDDPGRYDEAIEEERLYRECLEEHGLLPKGKDKT